MNWFDIIKTQRGKTLFKKWLRIFVREHLEGMEVGEMVTTKEMLELVEKGKSEGTFEAPETGLPQGGRPEMQVRFGSGRSAPKIARKGNSSIRLISQLIRENRDIVKRVTVSPKSTTTLGWERI
jgi:hypothetical protein